MIECYFKQCMYHSKDEPICFQKECQATDSQLRDLASWRTAEIARLASIDTTLLYAAVTSVLKVITKINASNHSIELADSISTLLDVLLALGHKDIPPSVPAAKRLSITLKGE